MRAATVAIALISLSALAACQGPSYQTRGHQTSHSENSQFNCIAGTIGGAVIGGLLGSTIGGGRGRTAATAVGAGAGGYIGNNMGCR